MIKEELEEVISKEKELESKYSELRMLEDKVFKRFVESEYRIMREGLKNETSDLGLEVLEYRKMVNGIIDKIEDDNQRFILRERYINGRSWDDITEMMFYSKRRVYEIHKEGLESYKKIKDKG